MADRVEQQQTLADRIISETKFPDGDQWYGTEDGSIDRVKLTIKAALTGEDQWTSAVRKRVSDALLQHAGILGDQLDLDMNLPRVEPEPVKPGSYDPARTLSPPQEAPNWAQGEGAGVLLDDESTRRFGYDGVPLDAKPAQFKDLAAKTRAWEIDESFYREHPHDGVQVMVLDKNGLASWEPAAYFATAEEMAISDDEPGRPGPGLAARERWGAEHRRLLKAEAFGLETGGDVLTMEEHAELERLQNERAAGKRPLVPIRPADARHQIADRENRFRLDDQRKSGLALEGRIKKLEKLAAGLSPGAEKRATIREQIRDLKEVLAKIPGAWKTHRLATEFGVEDMKEEDYRNLWGDEVVSEMKARSHG